MCTYNTNEKTGLGQAGSTTRRRFLKWVTLVSLGTGSDLLGASPPAGSASLAGIFRMNLDNYPALKNEFGSMLVKVAGMPASFPQIIVTRLANNQFAAVTSRCTHAGCTVGTYNKTSKLLVCPCHGSRYTATGAVNNGPASQPLAEYAATFDGVSVVSVVIPGLGFVIQLLPTADDTRLLLKFPAVSGIKYDVRFRSLANSGDWQVVSFSTTATGAFSQTTFTGNGSEASLYVPKNPESGFYTVTRF
jgi:Rieske Fe-S protein